MTVSRGGQQLAGQGGLCGAGVLLSSCRGTASRVHQLVPRSAEPGVGVLLSCQEVRGDCLARARC